VTNRTYHFYPKIKEDDMDIGVPELLIILVIVAMLFGVGRLPEIFGAVGKGIREFRKEAGTDSDHQVTTAKPEQPTEPPVDKSL
jgi:sec-independent protein translocase protein TatA